MDYRSRILIVDDTEINRSLLADMLSDEYEITEAADGAEAIQILRAQPNAFALVLLDIVMPRVDGFGVLEAMGQDGLLRDTPVITISAETSSRYIDRAYDLGATDFISRPFDERIVQRRVHNTTMLYAKQKSLERMVTEQIAEKERTNFTMVEILSNIVEFRNGESGLHVLHIRVVTELLLKKLAEKTDRYQLNPSKIAQISSASALHDIGKITIPEAILGKPGRLTDEEFAVMKTHAAAGAHILEQTPGMHSQVLLRYAYDICRWHHERYDGGGYPDGLRGEQIPIAAQAVSLADVYDALTSERVYKPAYSHAQALEMIFAGQCGAFNPMLLACLEELGSSLEAEIRMRASSGMSISEIEAIAAEVIEDDRPRASDRTLALLEQERIKYRFFASMSQEVQFEYQHSTKLLEISEWGSKYLALPELISHPLADEALMRVFSHDDLIDLKTRLAQTTPESPIVSAIYCLNVQGQPRWFKAVARVLWDGEQLSHFSTAIGKFIDVHEERMVLDSLQKQAAQDSLTTLYNHKAGRTRVEQALDRQDNQLAFLMILDVDHFKKANDRFGHIFGDDVLRHVAGLIRDNIRQQDIAARIGGDEFLIFSRCPTEQASRQIERIFNALSVMYRDFPISISMGVSFCPLHGKTYEALFHCADQALYEAKRRGRSQYVLYDPALAEVQDNI